MTQAIMLQGTASDVGKSVLVAGLCRIFYQDGLRTAPFKSQNMALNSGITPEGKEMGRAQIFQAQAAGITPDVRMNPVLLKPTSDRKAQVVLMGQVATDMDAVSYHAYKPRLREHIRDVYNSLAREYDVLVLEGAGSPAEINLRDRDIVNMGMAEMAQCPVILGTGQRQRVRTAADPCPRSLPADPAPDLVYHAYCFPRPSSVPG